MRVLLDTDVVLDLIMARLPFASTVGELFDLSELGVFEAHISALTPLNIFYIARKATTATDLRQAIKQLIQASRSALLTTPFSSLLSVYRSVITKMLCSIVVQRLAVSTQSLRGIQKITRTRLCQSLLRRNF
jgi:predicted nucleic acid-binding protein